MTHPDVERIAAGYDIVYAGIASSPTFERLWREHAIGPGYPEGFEHISFLTADELRRMTSELRLAPGGVLADLACGLGGPGLCVARDTGVALRGIDASPVAVAGAQARASKLGLASLATFTTGTFAATGLDAASCDAAMSCDALQYAPNKEDAFAEIARILRPNGRLVFVAFEFEPARVAGLPIMGTDPVDDYRPVLQRAGLEAVVCEETPGWRERVRAAYQAVLDAKEAVTDEIGGDAFAALSSEMSVTLQLDPYRRRVFAVASKR
jgi:ubiquinone/menaquinone biosynthesis C-methylase UbiE